jgi:hypothetical protein
MVTTVSLLPIDGIPPSGYPASEKHFWCPGDTVESYRRRGGHPRYGETDIVYEYNRLGYRCPEFDSRADLRVLAIGCSYAFGLGLPREQLFHELFAARLRAETSRSVVLWNLGKPAASNDYICRMAYLALRQLNPHVVLVNFTHLGRREYLSVQNKLIEYYSNWERGDAVTEEICGHFDALSSPFDDCLNFFRNYKAVETLLAGRTWLFSHIQSENFLPPLAEHLDREGFAGTLNFLDRARDESHPGERSHRQLYEAYWARFVERYGLEHVSERSSGSTAS